MSTDTLLTPSIITKESLVILANNLVMAGRVNRQFEEQMGAKIGTTLTIGGEDHSHHNLQCERETPRPHLEYESP